jgi:hypothetical protein
MVKCLAALLDFIYIARQNAIDEDDLDKMESALERFHEHRQVFSREGVCNDIISLPRQHSLVHYVRNIRLFGAPNGLCSSITEAKHIVAVKKPWRRSSHYMALSQMLVTNQRMDKMAAARVYFAQRGMLDGTTLSYTARELAGTLDEPAEPEAGTTAEEDDDAAPVSGWREESTVALPAKRGALLFTPSFIHALFAYYSVSLTESGYPRHLADLACHLDRPALPALFQRFLWAHLNTDSDLDPAHVPVANLPPLDEIGKVDVFHSAVATFYAPSDECGSGGIRRERIRCHPNWRRSYPRYALGSDEDAPMHGMVIGRVFLFFAVHFRDETLSAALVHWFSPTDTRPHPDTGLWTVRPEYTTGRPSLAVVPLDVIVRAAHLMPVFGGRFLPDDFDFTCTLDAFYSYFVNAHVDHHSYELLK